MSDVERLTCLVDDLCDLISAPRWAKQASVPAEDLQSLLTTMRPLVTTDVGPQFDRLETLVQNSPSGARGRIKIPIEAAQAIAFELYDILDPKARVERGEEDSDEDADYERAPLLLELIDGLEQDVRSVRSVPFTDRIVIDRPSFESTLDEYLGTLGPPAMLPVIEEFLTLIGSKRSLNISHQAVVERAEVEALIEQLRAAVGASDHT